MAQAVGIEFESQVEEAIRGLNYKVTTDPIRPPGTSAWQEWQDKFLSLLGTRPSMPGMPSMAVMQDGKVVLVEPKSYPILLGPIIQAHHYSEYYQAPVIICVPDDAFPQIPDSVREWAEGNDIELTPIGLIGVTLQRLLETKETP